MPCSYRVRTVFAVSAPIVPVMPINQAIDRPRPPQGRKPRATAQRLIRAERQARCAIFRLRGGELLRDADWRYLRLTVCVKRHQRLSVLNGVVESTQQKRIVKFANCTEAQRSCVLFFSTRNHGLFPKVTRLIGIYDAGGLGYFSWHCRGRSLARF